MPTKAGIQSNKNSASGTWAPARALGHAHITSRGQGPPLGPGGGEGRGEVGEMLSSDTAHLTLPSLREGPLPLPPQAGGEGPSPATRSVQANMCACPSASARATITGDESDTR